MIVLAFCLLAIGIAYTTVFDDREATDGSLSAQDKVPVSTDTDTASAGFLAKQ